MSLCISLTPFLCYELEDDVGEATHELNHAPRPQAKVSNYKQ